MNRSSLQVLSSPSAHEVRSFLADDPLYGAYALGYLYEPWCYATTFTLARTQDELCKALIVRYDERPQPAVYLFGSRRALVAAMSEDNLATWRRMLRQDNQDVWLAGQTEALDALAGFFYPLERRFLERWVLDKTALTVPKNRLPYPGKDGRSRGAAPAAVSGARTVTGKAISSEAVVPRLLSPADARLLNQLFSLPRNDPFGDEELERCAYYGIFMPDRGGVDEQCIAIAGTLVTARSHGIAAIGNVYTSPYWRGRGYATACVAALCAHHFAQGYQHVVLNVDQDNSTAQGIYRRLGFHVHCAYQEVRVVAL